MPTSSENLAGPEVTPTQPRWPALCNYIMVNLLCGYIMVKYLLSYPEHAILSHWQFNILNTRMYSGQEFNLAIDPPITILHLNFGALYLRTGTCVTL